MIYFSEEKKEINEEDEEEENNIINNEEEKYSINKKNLYIYNNFVFSQTIKENVIVEEVNRLQKGNLNAKFRDQETIMIPKIKYIKNKKEIIESNFISQKQMFEILLMEYNKFLENLDFDEFNKQILINFCLNIFIFMRNDETFKQLNDIMVIMENIFNIFIIFKNN